MQRIVSIVCLAGLVAGLAAAPEQKQDGPVTIQVVKYRELSSAIRDLRGKVVVVDIWADWCVPCKLAFPHLVELHNHYADAGLACVSVSLDEAKDKDKSLKFLREKKATFANFLLDEEFDYFQTRFDINGPPAIFVFDRDNRLAARFDSNDPDKRYTHEDVEKVVKELLQRL